MFRCTRKYAIEFVVMLLATSFAWAQESTQQAPKPPVGVYKIDYVFTEVQDSKRINSRTYSMLIQGRDRGSIRMGNRVPVVTGGNPKDIGSGAATWQYLDVGVNIDSRIEQELDSAIVLNTVVDISSVAPEQPAENRTGTPVIRQTRFQMDSAVPLAKQTLLTSADEIDSTRRFEVEVTVTKVR